MVEKKSIDMGKLRTYVWLGLIVFGCIGGWFTLNNDVAGLKLCFGKMNPAITENKENIIRFKEMFKNMKSNHEELKINMKEMRHEQKQQYEKLLIAIQDK